MLSSRVNHKQEPNDNGSTPVINDLKPVMEGLFPAFRDKKTGEIHLSLTQDGALSQDHSFFHLPDHWISKHNMQGDAITLIPTVEAGYWRSTGFIAVAKKIHLPLDS